MPVKMSWDEEIKPNHKDDPQNILQSRYKQLISVVNTGSASNSGSVFIMPEPVYMYQ